MNNKVFSIAAFTMAVMLSSVGNAENNATGVTTTVDRNQVLVQAYHQRWERRVEVQLEELNQRLISSYKEEQVGAENLIELDISI